MATARPARPTPSTATGLELAPTRADDLGFDTPLGAACLGFGATEGGHTSTYAFIGPVFQRDATLCGP